VKYLIAIAIVVGGLFYAYQAIDKRGYERGRNEADALAAKAITIQNREMSKLISSHQNELKTHRTQLAKERRESDDRIREALNKYEDFKKQWNMVLHDCVIAIFYGVHLETCPGINLPDRSESDPGNILAFAEDR
jgi:vacuolar-type H+-ATPase subunit I/STV1